MDEDIEIPKAWENFLEQLTEQNLFVPDFIQQKLDDFHGCGNTFGARSDEFDQSDDPTDVRQEDWQEVIDNHVFHADENIDADYIQWS